MLGLKVRDIYKLLLWTFQHTETTEKMGIRLFFDSLSLESSVTQIWFCSSAKIFHSFSFLTFLPILMEEIFSFNQYDQVLCLCKLQINKFNACFCVNHVILFNFYADFNKDESLIIFRSSNRLIKADRSIKAEKVRNVSNISTICVNWRLATM